MALLNAIRDRFSVRTYRDCPVEPAKLDAVLEAARLAPSARNVQEWRFVVAQDAAVRRALAAAASNQAFVGTAPVVIAAGSVLTDYVMRGGQLAYPIDLAIALEHMALQAVEEGLGTCWIGSFQEGSVRQILGIPAAVRIVGLMTLGYPGEPPRDKNRLPLDRIACRERWAF